MLPISVAFDHRVTGGAEVARFTNRVMYFLEHPEEIPAGGGADGCCGG